MASEPTALERHRGPAAIAVIGTCTIIAIVALLISGVTVSEVLLFVCFEIAFAIVPGLVLSFALLKGGRPLADTLAVAWPLGLAIEIGCFVLTAAVGERWLFTLYPAVFVVVVVPLLWKRRAEVLSRWPARLRTPVEREVAIAVLLVTAGAAFVVFLGLFAPSPLPRDIRSASYYPDLIFNVSLAAELLHHWPFMDPSVSGQSLHYHIFANVDMAATAQITRLDLATIAMRLQPTVLIGLIGVQLFALGRKVGGSRAAGLVVLTIGLFAGELNFSWHDLAGGGASVLGGLYSPSYQLGAVFFLAVLIVLVDYLALASHRSRAFHWTALGILSLGAVGAKSSVVPILACGLALFALMRVFLRRDLMVKATTVDDICGLAVIGAAGAAGYMLLYRGGGQGVTFKPLDFVSYSGLAPVYQRASHSLVYALAAVGAAAIVLCMAFLSLAGVLFVRDRWWPRESRSSPERLLLCMFAASLPPFVLIAVPGDSEAYFVVYGFLAASVVSAAGVTAVTRGLRLDRAELLRPGLVCAAGVLVVIVGLWIDRSPLALLPAYGLLACILALTTWMLRARVRVVTARPLRGLLVLGVIVVISLSVVAESFERIAPTIDSWLHGAPGYEASGSESHRGMTADLWRGLVWLRDHTRSADVIAVNNHDIGSSGSSRYFYYSAFSERRVFLESWDYTPQGYQHLSLGKTETPFPGLLALNDAAVLQASPAAISVLYDRYGVRYVVIDRLHGPASPGLSRVRHVVFANPDVTIFSVD